MNGIRTQELVEMPVSIDFLTGSLTESNSLSVLAACFSCAPKLSAQGFVTSTLH